MKPALLLIDFQEDYLSAPSMQPAAGAIVDRAVTLLDACRAGGVPVIHVWTTVHAHPDDRMPHWRAAGRWWCRAGAAGHATPAPLRPVAGEGIVDKQFFSGFGAPRLHELLRSASCDALILAGVHLHGCVRATALDAYERGYEVWIAEDAVGSDDPLHAAITRRYLARRAARLAPVAALRRMIGAAATAEGGVSLEHRCPSNDEILWRVPIDGAAEVGRAADAAERACKANRDVDSRAAAGSLLRLADGLIEAGSELAGQIAREVGKPVAMARAEVERSAAILRAVARLADVPRTVSSGPEARYRYEPLGVVAVVTPWNNPLAIPIGKIAPALIYGNAVVWKPAPAGTMVARRLLDLWRAAGLAENLLTLCTGDQSTAQALARDERVGGLSVSASSAAGYALQEICAARHVPFQGELGGNNGSIVCADADAADAARRIAEGAFAFAGQRCTANRRVIVMDGRRDEMIGRLRDATARLAWGDPRNEPTRVGPLISRTRRDEVASLLRRAGEDGLEVLTPHQGQSDREQLMERGAFLPPALVLCDRPEHEVVQEETFGPVLVVQRARDWEEAVRRCNGVRQGLAAALFSESAARQRSFLRDVRCGVLKINRSTADADAESPLGGWKASGVGPAEHGPCDREFFCRVQTIYNGPQT